MASPLFSLVPQNHSAEAVIENPDYVPYVLEFPDPQGENGRSRGLCIKFDPTSSSGLEPSFLGNHNGTDIPSGQTFRFMLNINTGEVLLEDYSDGRAFRFTGPTALTFPSPPHPRRLIIDCHNNLEFECIDGSGCWSQWRILWHQEPPMDVLLWRHESTGLRTGVVSSILTNDDGCEVFPGYNKTPDSADDLIRYTDRSRYFASKFGAPQAVVDVGTGQHLAVKKVSYPFKMEARRSLLDRVIRSSNLSHPHIIAFFQVQETPDSIDIIMPLKDGSLLGLIQLHQNGPGLFERPIEMRPLGRLLFGEMLSALNYLEHEGVVHRNICPRNILVNGLREKQNFHFYLSNFEYASFKDTFPDPGDPCFKAPETCGLTTAEESPRTDIWGLCATMAYFLSNDFRDIVNSKPSENIVAQAVYGASRMLLFGLEGMGEWDANDRPSARQKLEKVFGEGVEG
ncbi:Hypothetical protein NCS54_00454300 [Fusarium falciforme]|uniref:Hypothetical protein n=1 Tax=Fusarium falciforme TaxID=195108 RepID=UPI002300975B|nr:Hypothetical protein NCS54_00454300 [Fusarium falciforme]WAO87239.1 Hypothetical protein NCS54_00454300 [Fusarium falciforme]